MKRILTVLAAVILTAGMLAQVPQKMSYQAVIRDADNNLIMNQTIGMQISILQGSEAGTVVYSETLSPATNDNGLITIEIGGEAGFAEIDWADGPYFIKTEADPEGGSNYTIEGTSQLLAVPYALYAKSASNATETEPGFMSAEDKVKLDGLQNSDGSETLIISGTDIIVEGDGTLDNPYVIGTTQGAEFGEMRYWDGENWTAVLPGEDGLSLTLCGGVPIWGPCPGKAIIRIINVSNITESTANVSAIVETDGGNEVTERGVVYRTSPEPTTSHNSVSEGSGIGSFSVTLSGLAPGQLYYARGYAINAEGTAYSDQVLFTTSGVDYHGSVTDADDNVYQTVLIGNQEWMAENLRTTKYSDGTDIPNVTDNSGWAGLSTGAYALYNNNATLGNAYGAVYNFYAVETGNLCPTGWRVSTDDDWTELRSYIINNTHFGAGNVGQSIKSCRQIGTPLGGECDTDQHPRWVAHPETYGTDNFRFSGFPGGNREETGSFSGIGGWIHWWTSTEVSADRAKNRTLFREINTIGDVEHRKVAGLYIRCVRE